MKILIVENEIYLAQSIAQKLNDLGYECDTVASVNEALRDEHYEAILLSTNISQNFYPVIEKFQHSIIILLISYISNDTVSNPMKAGADDYIQKPFMIEELIRKLQHLKEFKKLKNENLSYKSYIEHLLETQTLNKIDKKTTFPVLIKSDFQKDADALVFEYSTSTADQFLFISLARAGAIEKISRSPKNQLLYVIDYQTLKKSEKEKLLEIIEDKKVILSSTNADEEPIENTIKLYSDSKMFDYADVLSIDDYVKYVITNFQNKFPDTELSKKLGISRKSLWEKRKKYGVVKKKERAFYHQRGTCHTCTFTRRNDWRIR